MRILDKWGAYVQEGDIIDVHQTINGQSLFVILFFDKSFPENKPDVRYHHDINRKYEYDVLDLLDVNKEEVEIEIVGNIYKI